jgi:hypothetical protein
MTCTESIDNLTAYIQSLLDANTDASCQEFVMPTDIATYTTAITTTCTNTSTSTITSPVSDRAYRLHNFDLPVHTFCDFVFRGHSTDVSTIPKSALWKSVFDNMGTIPPRIDTLSSTSPDEYQLLLVWTTLLQNYVSTAQTVNTNDAEMVELAHIALCNDKQYFQDQLDTLCEDQSHEDALQDAVDNPTACKELYAQERKQHAHERLQAKKRGKRCSTRRHTMHVPLNRASMQCYEHALVDSRYLQEQKEWQRKLDDNRVLLHNVEQKRLLGKTIGSVLCQATSSLHRMSQLIRSFIEEWKQCVLMCGVTEMPLMRRLAFQQQLKTTLFDLRALMRQQHTSNTALCENRCDSVLTYYPFFNYSTSSCYVPLASTTSEAFVLEATQTLHAYNTEQCVLREMNRSVLQVGAVVTKRDAFQVMEKLMRWKYILLLCGS